MAGATKGFLLDTMIFREWFRQILADEKIPDPEIIKILAELREKGEPLFLSIFSIAEIIHNIKDAPGIKAYKIKKGYLETIIKLTETLQSMTGCRIIEGDFNKSLDKIHIDSHRLMKYSHLADGVKDSVLLIIAEDNELIFVTKDGGSLKAKDAYEHTMGETSFVRSMKKKYDI